MTPPSLTRRALLAGTVATLAVAPGRAQVADPLVIRPALEGVEERYRTHATVGPRIVPTDPLVLVLDGLRIAIVRPDAAPRGRIVVFSHQALADPLASRNLLYHWASHGFVVVAPYHDDAITSGGGSIRKAGEEGVSEWDVGKVAADGASMVRRVGQLSTVLGHAKRIGDALGMEVVTDRPAVVGHGLGAYCAQLLLGADVSAARPELAEARNPRFFSGILMSPQGPGALGLTEDSWKGVASPLLAVVAEGDRDFAGQTPEQKWAPYALSAPGYKHLALVSGGGPNTFVGQSSGNDRLEAERLLAIKAATTAFLRAYADYDEASFADVSGDLVQRNTLRLVRQFRR